VALAGLAILLVLLAGVASAAGRPEILPKQGEGAADAPPVPEQAETGVDLAELERRLRATGAIGFLTKLSLKGQIDDLLDEFGRFHAQRSYRGVSEDSNGELKQLRERFNLLLMKVLSLIQDDDEELFGLIAAAREGLWRNLIDPRRFRAAAAGPGSIRAPSGGPVMLSRRSNATALSALAVWLLPAGAAGGVDTAKDLAAVIALQGKPCGSVVRFEQHGENDYTVHCASGHVYRVYVDSRGRVVVVERQ
jgi:hypothetical protein